MDKILTGAQKTKHYKNKIDDNDIKYDMKIA